MPTLSIWFQAIRPKTLFNSMSPVFIGTALSLKDGSFDLILFLCTLCTSLGIQICVNLANDYFDCIKGSDTSERKGPVRVTQAGLVSHTAIKIAVGIACLITLIVGSYLVKEGGWPIGTLLIISLLLALGYSGGPFPIAYLGLADIFVFIFFGPVAVAGTYYLQTHVLLPETLLCGIGPGLLCMAVLIVANIRDVEEDLQADKKTLIVRFGRTFGKWQYVICLIAAGLLPLLFIETHPAALLSSLILIPTISLIRNIFKVTDPVDYNPLLPKTAQLTFFHSILFSIGWML